MGCNLLQKLSIVGLTTLSLETAFLAFPSTVKAYPGPDEQCPYGWDTRTNTQILHLILKPRFLAK